MLQPVELMHRLESLIGIKSIGQEIADLQVKLKQNSKACSILVEEVDRCIADVARVVCSWACCGNQNNAAMSHLLACCRADVSSQIICTLQRWVRPPCVWPGGCMCTGKQLCQELGGELHTFSGALQDPGSEA